MAQYICRGTIGDTSFQINRLNWSCSFDLVDQNTGPLCQGVMGFQKIPTSISDAWTRGWGLIPSITVISEKRGRTSTMLFENVGLINKVYDGCWKFRFLASRVIVL